MESMEESIDPAAVEKTPVKTKPKAEQTLSEKVAKAKVGKSTLEELNSREHKLVIEINRPDGVAESGFIKVYQVVAIGYAAGLELSNEAKKPKLVGYMEDGKVFKIKQEA